MTAGIDRLAEGKDWPGAAKAAYWAAEAAEAEAAYWAAKAAVEAAYWAAKAAVEARVKETRRQRDAILRLIREA